MFVWLCRYHRIDRACEFCLNVFIETSRLDDTSGEEMKKKYYNIWYLHCIIRVQSQSNIHKICGISFEPSKHWPSLLALLRVMHYSFQPLEGRRGRISHTSNTRKRLSTRITHILAHIFIKSGGFIKRFVNKYHIFTINLNKLAQTTTKQMWKILLIYSMIYSKTAEFACTTQNESSKQQNKIQKF